MMGRLWMEQKMDLLVMVSYAAYNSAFGIIEHDWAIVSSALAGIRFPTTLDDELLPPQKQRDLTEDQRRTKEAKLFDSNLKHLSNIYSTVKTAGFPAIITTIPCTVCQTT
jgi:hypothetical protein